MYVGIDGKDPRPVDSFTIRFEGSAEILGLAQALEFLAEEVKRPMPRSISEPRKRQAEAAVKHAQAWHDGMKYAEESMARVQERLRGDGRTIAAQVPGVKSRNGRDEHPF